MDLRVLPRESYHVGIICALPIEKAAVEAVLDEEHGALDPISGDENVYAFGRIGEHNVVVACLPAGSIGKTAASTVATHMMRSFSIKAGLMVGICGGVPSRTRDIRLGDIIVSQPTGAHGGVVHYDFGKLESHGRFRRTGMLNKPPTPLLTALSQLKADRERKGCSLEKHIKQMLKRHPNMAEHSCYQGHQHDKFFNADYAHESGESCDGCDQNQLVDRTVFQGSRPQVHYGNIASGDCVMKDGQTRDYVAKKENIIGFEMEAAGLVDRFPCIVIRGVCDYADSHKNKRWQPHAAAMAACYAKAFLLVVNASSVNSSKAVGDEWRIPFSLAGIPVADHYVQRTADTSRITSFFLSASDASGGALRRKVFVVSGLGGIGKTQLCVDFMRAHKNIFTATFWLDGSSRDAFRQSLADQASRVRNSTTEVLPRRDSSFGMLSESSSSDIETRLRHLRRWLSKAGNHRWLLVIDNLDCDWTTRPPDPNSFDYTKFLPEADHGNILITTRLASLQTAGASLALDKVDASIARQILESRGYKAANSDLSTLLETLDGLPLALVQAGAYLAHTMCSVGRYLEFYRTTWSQLIQSHEKHATKDYSEKTILTTWIMSYRHVSGSSPAAARLLDIWAFLDHRDIWHELAASSKTISKISQQSLDRTVEPVETFVDPLFFYETLGELSRFSLVQASESNAGFSIHPVVHAWCLHNIADQDQKDRLCRHAMRLVTRMVTTIEETSTWRNVKRLLPHARAVAERQLLSSRAAHNAARLSTLANFLYDRENSGKSQELYLQALGRYPRSTDPALPYTIQVATDLGSLYFKQNELVRAESILDYAIEESRKRFGDDHDSTIHAMFVLGKVYFSQGKIEDAAITLLAAKNALKSHSPRSIIYIEILDALGGVYARQGKSEKAEKMGLSALHKFRSALGEAAEPTLRCALRCSHLYLARGKVVDAERLCKWALRTLEEVVGPDHELTLRAVGDLGHIFRVTNRFEQAEKLHLRELQGLEDVWGKYHKSTLDAMGDLGSVYLSQGRLDEAEKMLVDAVQGFKLMSNGEGRIETIIAMEKVGELYQKQDKLDKSEKLFRQALRGYERLEGNHDRRIEWLEWKLRSLHRDQVPVTASSRSTARSSARTRRESTGSFSQPRHGPGPQSPPRYERRYTFHSSRNSFGGVPPVPAHWRPPPLDGWVSPPNLRDHSYSGSWPEPRYEHRPHYPWAASLAEAGDWYMPQHQWYPPYERGWGQYY